MARKLCQQQSVSGSDDKQIDFIILYKRAATPAAAAAAAVPLHAGGGQLP